jgi:hypothetical protein
MTEKEKKRRCEERILSYKYLHPCKDCGITNPVVLEFDHIRGKKVDNISDMPGKYPWLDIIREIKKCDVVCANCHRLRTAKKSRYFSQIQNEVQKKFQRAQISNKILTPKGLIPLEKYYQKKGLNDPSSDISDYY